MAIQINWSIELAVSHQRYRPLKIGQLLAEVHVGASVIPAQRQRSSHPWPRNSHPENGCI